MYIPTRLASLTPDTAKLLDNFIERVSEMEYVTKITDNRADGGEAEG